MNTIETKFGIGDKVWEAVSRSVHTRKVHWECGQGREVTGMNICVRHGAQTETYFLSDHIAYSYSCDLFATQAAVQEACDRRNKKEGESADGTQDEV